MSNYYRALIHELRCRDCRVTWKSWLQRLIGDDRGMSPIMKKTVQDANETPSSDTKEVFEQD